MTTRLISIPILILVIFAWPGSMTSYAQRTETGFLNRSVKAGTAKYRYQVFIPRDYSRTKKWPVILALHGGGEYGSDGFRQTNVGIATAIRRNEERFPAIVIFPQSKADGTPGWQLEGGKAALAALDKTIREFRGDPKRVILTGYSAGGNGSWFLASQYPERFAALVVVCGFVSQFRSPSNGIVYPAISSENDVFAAVAKRVSSIPIQIFHGALDDIVKPDESRKMAAKLNALGADISYTELPKANHNAWDPAYERADLIEWMLKQRKR